MSSINFQDVIGKFEKAQADANAANEARYTQLIAALQDLMGRSAGTYDDILKNIESTGGVARQRVERDTAKMIGRSEQDLISRGLGNTTIRSSVQRGIRSDAEFANQAIDEQLTTQRANALQSRIGDDIRTTGMFADAIERRNDIGPDLGQYAALLSQAAAAGAGGAGGKVVQSVGPGSSSFGVRVPRDGRVWWGSGG